MFRIIYIKYRFHFPNQRRTAGGVERHGLNMYIIIRKKHVVSAVFCILLALAVGIFFTVRANQATVSAAAENTNWGLGFHKKEKSPLEMLQQTI